MITIHQPPLECDQRVSLAFKEAGRVTWCTGRVLLCESDLVRVGLEPEPPMSLRPFEGADLSVDTWRPMDARYLMQARLVEVRPGSPSVIDLRLLEITRVQRRQSFRVPVTITADQTALLGPDGRERPLTLYLHDLSAGGLGGVGSVPLAVGDRLRIVLPISAKAPPLEIMGRVVRADEGPTSPNRPSRVGIAFVGVPPQVYEQLVQLTLAVQAEQRRRGLL